MPTKKSQSATTKDSEQETSLEASEQKPEPPEEKAPPVATAEKFEIGKTIRNQNGLTKTLIRFAEPRDLPDEDLPDIMELLQRKPDEEEESSAEPRKYQTLVNNATQGRNLIVYPAIAGGRCELCGATRFVHKRNGQRGEVWRVVNTKGEDKYQYVRGDWVEVHAANCPHYRHIDIHCSYCQEQFTGQKDNKGSFVEKLASRILYVFATRQAPNSLVMVCSDMRCKGKFDTEYHLNQTV